MALTDADVGLGTTIVPASPQRASRSVTPMSDEAVGLKPDQFTQALSETNVDRALTSVFNAAKSLGKGTLAAGDMIFGLGGQALGLGVNVGGRTQALLRGESRKIAGITGEIAQEQLVPEVLNAPLSYLMKKLGGGEAYDQQAVATLIENLANKVEQTSRKAGILVTAEDAKLFFNAAMLGLGVKGTQAGAKAVQDRIAAARQAAEVRRIVDGATAVDAPLAGARAKASAQPEQPATTINRTLGIRTPKEVEAAQAAKRKDVKKAFDEPAPGSDYSSIENSIFRADERISNHEAYTRAQEIKDIPGGDILPPDPTVTKTPFREGEPVSDSAILVDHRGQPVDAVLSSGMHKVRTGQGATLTAEELIAVRQAARASEQLMQGPGRLQRGSADWKAVASTFVATAAGTALGVWGYKKYKEWEASQQELEETPGQKFDRDMEEHRRLQPSPINPEDPLPAPKPNRDGLFEAMDPSGLLPFAVAAGAVKMKGGMWHPEAVTRLSKSMDLGRNMDNEVVHLVPDLRNKLGREPTAIEIKDAYDKLPSRVEAAWGDRAVKNYLNKHAGTSTDPLKDIEIPFGEGTKRWEDVTDAAFVSSKASDFQAPGDRRNPTIRAQQDMFKGAKPDEDIWQISVLGIPKGEVAGVRLSEGRAITALNNYLSHMGDYARQNIPPEKLAQYDFVRLAQETYKNDLRVAKEMERAAAASTKDLPVYRDYTENNPGTLEGMKWVELTVPERLTPEQARSVRPATDADLEALYGDANLDAVRTGAGHIAISSDGKPIVNNYTKDIVWGATPEEAWAAGRLAEEGNQLGHCVSGYCDAVASGESRIYSLRDAKGKSHVTIEVQPPGRYGGGAVSLIKNTTPDIVQIKGKQNRAPVAQYIPYVQDFVRSGKWGDVGDLDNTGLIQYGNKYLTPDELGPAQSEFMARRGQEGKADHRLLTAIGSVTGGATIISLANPEDPLRGAIYGALAGGVLGTQAGRTALQTLVKSPDVALGAISTRLGNMAPELKHSMRTHELNVLQKIERINDQVLPFIQTLGNMPKQVQDTVANALLNGRMSVIEGIPQLRNTYRGVAQALSQIETELQGLGRFGEGLVGYFPRMVKDFEGLKKHLGQEHAKGLELALVEADAKMIRKHGRHLTDVEQSIVANRYLYKQDQTSFQPGYAKSRRIKEVTPELQQFYETPTDSLLRYISGAVNDIETARFFGRDLKVNKQGKKVYNNIDKSIGNLTARLMSEGKITSDQAAELRDILKARFEYGDKGMHPALGAARNITNTALLGNVASMATQIGDSLMTVYHQGLVPTIQAVAQRVAGKQKMTPKQLGLINHIAEELSERGITGKALHNTMKWSGFHAVDMFAKGLNLNAGLIKNTKLAQTISGRKLLQERWGQAFGEEFPALLDDLKNKRVTDRVEQLQFAELSDAQPVSKAEMPEAYLRNPNGRILYQLKTYMLKQADIVRRDVYQNLASGKPSLIMKGAKNAAALGAIYAAAGIPGDVIKDWLSGRDIDPFSTPQIVENVLQTFGVNRYAQAKLEKGQVTDFVQDLVTPPARVFEDLVKTIHSAAGNGMTDWKGASYIPILGRPAYDRWLDGNVRKEISQKRLYNTGRPVGDRQKLSPEARDYLKRKRDDRKRKAAQP